MRKVQLMVVMLVMAAVMHAQMATTPLKANLQKLTTYVNQLENGTAEYDSAKAHQITQQIDISNPAFVKEGNVLTNVSFLWFLNHYSEMKKEALESQAKPMPGLAISDDAASYGQLNWVLKQGSDDLKNTFVLSCMEDIFGHFDLTQGVQNLKPLVEANMPEGEKKTQLLALYKAYERTAPGQPVPEFSLEDYKHNIHHLSEWKGKYLVIDFWATWCGVCIKNLPSYAELASQYANDSRISFITISIDNAGAFKKWMYSLPRFNLLELTNLIAPDSSSDFAHVFNVRGVPRYVIIGPDQRIVTAKAPFPHDGLDDYLKKLLK